MKKIFNHLTKTLSNENGFTITGAIITAGVVAGAGAVASSAIQSSAASKAAETQAAAQREQVASAERIAEQERLETARIAEEQRKATEAATLKEEQERAVAIEQKQAALAQIKIPRLTETETGGELLTNLRDRLAGRGVGFEQDITQLTAPYAAQRRAGLEEETIPTISAAASARGLGRSTIPVSQIGQESRAVERDIASEKSRLNLAQEQQKRTEINDAFGRLQQLNLTEIRLNEDIARFERDGQFEIADDLRTDADAISRQTRDLESKIADLERGIAQRETQFQLSIAELTKQQGVDAAANQILQGNILSGGILGAAEAFSEIDLVDTFKSIDEEETGGRVRILRPQDVGVQPTTGGSGFNFGGF